MDVEVGTRVTYGASGKSGVARYVGEVESLSGEWVGIELDKPEGKHNGELNGKVYFRCPANHGVFVKKTQVKVLAARAVGAGASPTTRSPGSFTSRSSTLGAGSSGSASASSTASRLQLMRDRRASGIGLPGSSASIRPPSGSSAVSTNVATTPSRTASPGSASGTAAGALRRTPSSTSSSTPSSSITSSRMSLDGNARRAIGRVPLAGSSDELAEAHARIAKLEEELDDRNRHVEQLKQNLVVLRETHETRDNVQDDVHTPEASESAGTPMDVDGAGASDESHLLEKIEAIRQEAEDHVRNVRGELEDHIAQLQSEHEDLVDELRLENATQSSEIKALETEITQQKARIAQFTAGEQKKAEEVALAVARTSAGARKMEALEGQISELQEMVETMTLEKETLEMDKEIAEERVEELVAEIEKLKTSLVLAATTTHSSAGSATASDLSEENMKLRAAVKALHDRSSEEKNELNRKLRQLQRENADLHTLREEVEHLTQKKIVLDGEVEELKELLDVANAYESMVEDLTEKNLTLGEKVADLEASVSSLESLKEMSEEMEHQQAEYEAQLNQELESQRTAVLELKSALSEQKTVVEDRDRTIARFRDVATRNNEEINQLKAQIRAETGELESLKGTTHSALNQTMVLRMLAASAREKEAEAARQKINADQARLENSFLRAAVPSSIFSAMDQQALRVRLRLGRISGKADILLQYLRKDLDALIQQDSKDDTGFSVLDSERIIQQLVLGERLASLSCHAKEDLFVLECHLTTSEEYLATCSRLDSTQFGLLESTLDGGLSAFADGSLFITRTGESSVFTRVLATVDDWIASRASVEHPAEGFPMRCAVVKFRSKKSALSLSFSFGEMLTFIRTVKAIVLNPETQLDTAAKQSLPVLFDKVADEFGALLKLAQHLYRRGEIDLAWSDDDLDGSVAVGGDVVELMYAYADESRNLWAVLQEQLSISKIQNGDPAEIASFSEHSLLVILTSLKDRLASLFKSVCRGAFIDAVSSRARDRIDMNETSDRRPQWQIRAQTIHKELLNASTLQTSLSEMNELCQVLHNRVRDLERADSQHRVVAQKLESEILRLTDSVGQSTSEKSRFEEQLAREREQFNIALDESHKEKAALDNLNRELRKQLKRTSDIGASSSSGSSRGKSGLSQGDTEAFRKAFEHLHGDLHCVRAQLAKERIDRVLGPIDPRAPAVSSSQSKRLAACAKEATNFSRQVKTQLSMPRMVDLTQLSISARDQLVKKKLEHAKLRETLCSLRTRISTTMQEDGWGGDVVTAIDRGENVFGWCPPEMERPPVLLSRVTLRREQQGGSLRGSQDHEMEDVNAASPTPIQLMLNQLQVKHLAQSLVF